MHQNRTFEQIAKDASEKLYKHKMREYRRRELESLHPTYDREANIKFVRELYRLIGFSYLRRQQLLA